MIPISVNEMHVVCFCLPYLPAVVDIYIYPSMFHGDTRKNVLGRPVALQWVDTGTMLNMNLD